jgi:hypothetical protein
MYNQLLNYYTIIKNRCRLRDWYVVHRFFVMALSQKERAELLSKEYFSVEGTLNRGNGLTEALSAKA